MQKNMDAECLKELINRSNRHIQLSYMDIQAIMGVIEQLEIMDKTIHDMAKACYLTWTMDDYNLFGIGYSPEHDLTIINIEDYFRRKAQQTVSED